MVHRNKKQVYADKIIKMLWPPTKFLAKDWTSTMLTPFTTHHLKIKGLIVIFHMIRSLLYAFSKQNLPLKINISFYFFTNTKKTQIIQGCVIVYASVIYIDTCMQVFLLYMKQVYYSL